MSEKSKKIRAKSRKLDEDAMLCNTLWSDRCRLITKTFLAFSHTSKGRGIDPNFPQKKVFFLFWLYSKRNVAFQQKKKISLAMLNAIIYHIRSN